MCKLVGIVNKFDAEFESNVVFDYLKKIEIATKSINIALPIGKKIRLCVGYFISWSKT